MKEKNSGLCVHIALKQNYNICHPSVQLNAYFSSASKKCCSLELDELISIAIIFDKSITDCYLNSVVLLA